MVYKTAMHEETCTWGATGAKKAIVQAWLLWAVVSWACAKPDWAKENSLQWAFWTYKMGLEIWPPNGPIGAFGPQAQKRRNK